MDSMIISKILEGEKIVLRQIELSDCTERYVEWLNDPEVNQYLETKWVEQSLETVEDFVRAQRQNDDSILWAIITKEGLTHIGNIKIGPINKHHHHADISYFIGEKDYWGKGIATEAIQLVTEYGLNELKLHKLEAGTYEDAIGSQKALEKNGYVKEGVLKEHIFSGGGGYKAAFRYGKILYFEA